MPLLSSIQRPEPPADVESVLPAIIHGLIATLHSYEDLFGPYHPQSLGIATQLALALWRGGDIGSATNVLGQAVENLTSVLGREHPARLEALTALSGLFYEQSSFEEASLTQREVVRCLVNQSGPDAPNSLVAKADLAAILFEQGSEEEAEQLERESFDAARARLGGHHFVTSLIAWNRVHRYERRGHAEEARAAIVDDLLWLLSEDPDHLDPGQNTIRCLLAERLSWNTASAC